MTEPSAARSTSKGQVLSGNDTETVQWNYVNMNTCHLHCKVEDKTVLHLGHALCWQQNASLKGRA